MACHSVNLRTASVARRSAAIVVTSQLRSSAVRNFACSGRSVSTKNVSTPITTVGIASAMYITCQPFRPNKPSRPSSDAEQEAHDCEARRIRNRGGEARQDSPSDHDPGDPYPGADLFQDHVARHL